MPNKKINIPYFDQYYIKENCLSEAQLPKKAWSFIDSLPGSSFDMLDVATFFGSDMATSKKIVDFLVLCEICVPEGLQKCSYDEWLEDNSLTLAISTPEAPQENLSESAPLETTSEDTDITVTKQAQSISVDIG